MSLDQRIALTVIEEPQIINFIEPDGTENVKEPENEIKDFLKIWEQANMNLENLEKIIRRDNDNQNIQIMQKIGSSKFHLFVARQALLNTLEVLKSIDILADKGKDFYAINHTEYSNTQSDEKIELNIGGLILDKQLQLQNSAERLAKTAEELSEVVQNSKIYYRKLEDAHKKYKLQTYYDKATMMSIIGLVNPIKVPPTSSAMLIQLDKEKKEVEWNFSNNLRLAVNGYHYEPNTDIPFVNLTAVMLQENLFRHLQKEGCEQNFNYLINESSMRIPVKGLKGEIINFDFTVESEKGTLTPVWLPALVKSSIPIYSTPLSSFTSSMKTADLTFFLFEFITKRFSAIDICTVNTLFSNKHAIFKISSLFTSDVATAIAAEDCIILSTPTHMKLPIRIEMKEAKEDHKLNHWADVTWFLLFKDAVNTYTRTFGFPVEDLKNKFIVKCDDRTVEFEATHFTNEAYVSISMGSIQQQFLWSNARGYSLQAKLNFLFFADIAG